MRHRGGCNALRFPGRLVTRRVHRFSRVIGAGASNARPIAQEGEPGSCRAAPSARHVRETTSSEPPLPTRPRPAILASDAAETPHRRYAIQCVGGDPES